MTIVIDVTMASINMLEMRRVTRYSVGSPFTSEARMRRLILMVSVLLAGCGGSDAAAPPGGGTTTTTVDVFTPGNIFSPFSTTITVGSTVNFNISGSSDGHNVLFH